MPKDSKFGQHLKAQHDKHVHPNIQKTYDKLREVLLQYREYREAHIQKRFKELSEGKELTETELLHLEARIAAEFDDKQEERLELKTRADREQEDESMARFFHIYRQKENLSR